MIVNGQTGERKWKSSGVFPMAWIPGAPLTYFNDGGVRQRFTFHTQKNPNFRICLPKKIPTFFSIPKKIRQCFLHQQILLLIFWNNWVSDTSLYGFINHFGKLDVMLLIFSRELLHTTKKMGSQLTGPLSSCWNSTALTPGLSLVTKSVFLAFIFYVATWSFDNRYISAGKHLIHKTFTLYTVFPLCSWWLVWKALNYVTYWIFLSGLDARGVPVITFQIDYKNIP